MSALYDLTLQKTEFRAAGMHDAQAIQRVVAAAVREALEECRLVDSIESGPIVRMSASPKNFAPSVSKPTDECEPLLGCATTAQLLNELMVRAEIGGYAAYRTVDGYDALDKPIELRT